MSSNAPSAEERFRALLEHGQDVILFLSPEWDVVWASPSLTRLLGWMPSAILGKRLSWLVHPEDLARTRAWRDLLFSFGENQSQVAGVSDPCRLQCRDGDYLWCALSLVRTFDDAGAPSGVSVLIHQVDSLMRAQLALARGEVELAAVVDAQVDPHVLYRAVRDEAGLIVDFEFAYLNGAAAEFEHRSVEELRGLTILQVEQDREEAEDDVNDCRIVLESGQSLTINAVESTGYLDSRGRPRILDIRVSKVGEDLVSYAFRDVSEQHAAAEAAAAAHTILRAVFDTMLEPHALFRAVRDEDGRIVDLVFEDANDAAAAFEGYPRDVLIGSTIRQLYRDQVEAAHDIADCVTVLETGRPLMANDIPSNNYADGEGRPVVTDIRIVPVDAERVSYAWRDVTERRWAQRLVEQSEQRFRLLAENMSDVVLLVRDGVVEWISPSVTAVAGWLPEDVVGTAPVDMVHPDDLDRVIEAWLPAKDLLPRLRYRLMAKDGTYHWVDAEGRVATDPDGGRLSIVSTRTVDTEVAALEALESMARHDELTGLVNRHEVFRQIDRLVSGPARTGTRVAMAFCDLDGFKDVNDSLGHQAGDELLRIVARRLERAVRSGDVVARLGGDELLVVLNGVHDTADAMRIAEKLRSQVCLPTPLPGGTVTVTASIGVALVETGESAGDIIARADAAMYQAKRAGKDRVVTIPSVAG